VNVRETFLVSYECLPRGRQSEPLHAHAVVSVGAAYNMALMSMPEWLVSPLDTTSHACTTSAVWWRCR
jgi:hypothetical protein